MFSRLQSKPDGYKDIKTLINPFILRRIKTDKSIISDLPDKNEIDITISLTKEQIILYKRVVEAMNANIRKHHDRKEERKHDKKDYDVHPYILGALLGDGTLNSGSIKISTTDEEIVSEFEKLLGKDYELVRDQSCVNYRINYKKRFEFHSYL